MIPDSEDVDPHIDFTFYYFTAVNKLGMTYREAGRITITLFNRLYQHYKDTFDAELILRLSGTTYAEARAKADKDEEWL